MSLSEKPFRFLDLPPEIREKIYLLICTSPSPFINLSTSKEDPFSICPIQESFPHSLLLSTAQIYHELRPLYFTTNSFSLFIRRRNDPWFYFLSPSFLDNRRQIRSLRVVVLRWGTKNFFTDEFGPVIEDCILNGRLRKLEIVVKERAGWEEHLESTGDGRMWLKDWLKKILGDVYLEIGVLRSGHSSGLESELLDDRETHLKDITWILGIKGRGGTEVHLVPSNRGEDRNHSSTHRRSLLG